MQRDKEIMTENAHEIPESDLNELNFETLEEFGLTPYEAKVYYTMLNLNLSSAREISNESGIPFGRIYDVLGSLESKNLLDIQDSYPKKYMVINPKEAVKNLLKRKKDEFEQLTEKAKVLETHLKNLYENKTTKETFWSIATEQKTITRHINRIEEAEKELLLCEYFQSIEEEEDGEDSDLIRQLKGLLYGGVAIKLLSNTPDIKEQLQKILEKNPELSAIQVRFNPKVVHTFDIIDSEKVILKMTNPLDLNEYLVAIYVWHKTFAKNLRDKFLTLWKNGKELLI